MHVESEAPTARSSPESPSMTCFRGFSLYSIKALCTIWCIFFHHAVSGPCLVSGTEETVEEKDKLLISDCIPAIPNDMLSKVTSGTVQVNSEPHVTIRNVGSSSGKFIFPSTLLGSSHGSLDTRVSLTDVEDSASKLSDTLEISCPGQGALGLGNSSWSSDNGMSNLLNGRAISCSLNSIRDMNRLPYRQTANTNQNNISSCRGPLFNHKVVTGGPIRKSKRMLSSSFNGSLSPHIDIDPPLLDWGEKYLYVPSLAYLIVSNTRNDSSLHVYQPFSTDSQFLPCNFTELILAPGEVASICFIFLPRSLGLSSAHLILQTSFGGLLVQAKGFAAELPYGQALSGSEVSSNGRWRKNLSVFNPFNETIYMKEVAMWVSVSLGNTSLHIDATCSIHESDLWDSSENSFRSIKDWFLVQTENVDPLLMAMRPLSNWEISPHTGETVAEIDLSFGLVGRIAGAFCMQLKRASQDEDDIVLLPVEAEIDRKTDGDGVTGMLTVSLEGLSPLDADEGIVTVSVRNTGSQVVRLGKISEIADSELLQIRYMEGLLLFPRTTTKVALVSCIHAPEISDVNGNCKLLIQTNDSRSPIEVNCNSIVFLCSRCQDSSAGCENPSSYGFVTGNMRTGSLTLGTDLLPHAMALGTLDLDNLVLQNWKSEGTNTEVSVLEDHELLFSVVQVGDHHSKWITVRNPSQYPVVMQLILNSMEIMDKCQAPVDELRPVSSAAFFQSKSTSPRQYGFSLADWARTEAYIHPQSMASLGPIIFHPSSRCQWRSSALIRNNLTGVEWVSLGGSGGSYSLVLVDNSKPVWTLDFKLEMPESLNFSLPEAGAQIDIVNKACLRPMVKELYAKNMGDFLLSVRHIKVSGTDCGSNGFWVQNCSHFILRPGQSLMLLVSYSSDFSGSVARGDLELVLSSGIVVIPMRASIPIYMLGLCRKSLFWTRVKKLFAGFLIVAPFLCVVLFSLYPQSISFCSEVFHYKVKQDPFGIIRSVGKSSSIGGNKRNACFISPSPKAGLFLPVDEEEPLLLGSVRCADDHESKSHEAAVSAQHKSYQADSLKERGPLNLISSKSQNGVEPSQLGGLTVKIGKEKGRRRRKRKGASAVLTGLFEGSSSHSGNSTPSSPLSPISSITPRRMWTLSPDGDSNPLVNAGSAQETISAVRLADPEVPIDNKSHPFPPEKQRPSLVSGKMASKPMLLTSGAFPCAVKPNQSMPLSSHFLSSTATIAPHARAPGSKLHGEKSVKPGEKPGSENFFTYDIWGDHLSGLRPLGRGSVDDSGVVPTAMNSDSESFFVRGPQALMTEYLQEYEKAVSG